MRYPPVDPGLQFVIPNDTKDPDAARLTPHAVGISVCSNDRNPGAGEGIRTLDPNLGKVLISLSGAIQLYPTALHITDNYEKI